MDLLRQFNKFADARKNLIQKALTSATNVGEALVPQHLEQIITNTIVRLAPELAMIEPEFDNQKFHEFNRITALPGQGGAMGEAAVTPVRNSTYQRVSVPLKVIRRKGSVTNFLQDSSKKYIDAAAAEMENHLTAHVYDLCTYLLYGNADASPYEFDGLDKLIQTNRTVEAVGGTAISALTTLDAMIDKNLIKQGANHRKAFLMSPEMLSKVSSLLTNVRLNQGLSGGGLTQVEVNGGWRLAAYRDIPIIASMGTRPRGTMTTVVAASGGTTGGAFSDGAKYFRVAPITYNGEELASAEATVTLSGGGSTQWITLTFTAFPGALSYKVYYGTATGNLKLIKWVPAFAYDGSGTIGAAVTVINVMTATPAADVPAALQNDVPLTGTVATPPELIILWDLDKYQGLGKLAYTNSGGARFNGLVTMEPLARTDDDLPFLIKTYGLLVPAFEATCVMHRGLKTA